MNFINYKVKKDVYVRIENDEGGREHIEDYIVGKIYIGTKLDKPEIIPAYFTEETHVFTHKVYLDYPSNSYLFTDEDMIDYFYSLSDYREEQINKIIK